MTQRTPIHVSREEWLRAPGPMVWRRTFPGTGEEVARARAFVKELLSGTGCEDDAGLIATELVNNVVLHTRSKDPGGWFGIEVVLGEIASLAVTDQGGGGLPVVKLPEVTEDFDLNGLDQSGRGLFIVSELAISLDIQGSPAYGHTIRAVLDVTMKALTA